MSLSTDIGVTSLAASIQMMLILTPGPKFYIGMGGGGS